LCSKSSGDLCFVFVETRAQPRFVFKRRPDSQRKLQKNYHLKIIKRRKSYEKDFVFYVSDLCYCFNQYLRVQQEKQPYIIRPGGYKYANPQIQARPQRLP